MTKKVTSKLRGVAANKRDKISCAKPMPDVVPFCVYNRYRPPQIIRRGKKEAGQERTSVRISLSRGHMSHAADSALGGAEADSEPRQHLYGPEPPEETDAPRKGEDGGPQRAIEEMGVGGRPKIYPADGLPAIPSFSRGKRGPPHNGSRYRRKRTDPPVLEANGHAKHERAPAEVGSSDDKADAQGNLLAAIRFICKTGPEGMLAIWRGRVHQLRNLEGKVDWKGRRKGVRKEAEKMGTGLGARGRKVRRKSESQVQAQGDEQMNLGGLLFLRQFTGCFPVVGALGGPRSIPCRRKM